MKTLKIIFCFIFLFFTHFGFAQLEHRANKNQRTIPPGRGQEFAKEFKFVDEKFYFIQFGVYPAIVNKRTIKAPIGVRDVWLIEHSFTSVKSISERGAFYIVKPYPTADSAKGAARWFKSRGIDCWYNEKLTGASFTLIGFSELSEF